MLFQRDLDTACSEVDRVLPWTKNLDDVRYGALVNMMFNIGANRLLGFKKTLSLFEQGRFNEVSIEMLNSKWANQVKDRAVRLSEQIKTGIWQ